MHSKYLSLLVIMTIAGLYGCKDSSITMPEDNNKIEYTIIDGFEDYFLGEIYFTDKMNGLISCMVGQRLLKTSDGGNSWQYVFLDSKSGYTDLSFINSNEGWLIRSPRGDKISVLHSIDAGKSWGELYFFDNKITTPSFLSIAFVNDSVGWVSMCNDVTSTLEIFKTVNGGRDWILQKSDIKASYFPYNNFVNENTGWISTNSNIYKTPDGGRNWINQGQNIPRVLDIYPLSNGKIDFIDEYTGFIIQNNFLLFRTDDGGETWYNIFTDNSVFTGSGQYFHKHYCYDFFNNKIGAISADSLYITRDGGNNWDFVYGSKNNDDNYISNLCFASENTLFAVEKNHDILKFTIH